MRWLPVATLIAIAAMALPASAQVHRCKDGAGKITYSDQPCNAAQSGGVLERQRSREQVQEERFRAAEANERKQLQRLDEQEREWAAQNQRALQPMAAPAVRHSGNDWAARKALENAATSASSITNDGGRWDQAAKTHRPQERREETRRKSAAAPPPTGFTNCVPGFCYDNQGQIYNRVSQDFMTGPSGKTCHRTGSMWNCS